MRSSYPGLAFNPAASMPAMAQISSLSDVSPETPTAPSSVLPFWIRTPPGTGTRRPCASVFTALTKKPCSCARSKRVRFSAQERILAPANSLAA